MEHIITCLTIAFMKYIYVITDINSPITTLISNNTSTVIKNYQITFKYTRNYIFSHKFTVLNELLMK